MRQRFNFVLGMVLGAALFTLGHLSAQLNVTTGRMYPLVATQNCSGTCSVNLSSGTAIEVTLTGAVTSLTFTGGAQGVPIPVTFCQDATGARTITGVNAAILGLTTPGVTASKCNPNIFYYNGTNYKSISLGLNNL